MIISVIILLVLSVNYEAASPCQFRTIPYTKMHQGRASRYFHARIKHDTKSDTTYQLTRIALSGDVELNPGPQQHSAGNANGDAGTLHLLTQNVRSIRNKLGDLRSCAPEFQKFDVIAWTETWLDVTVDSAELQSALPDHTWLRRDRATHGGGVACAARTCLGAERREDLEAANTETLVVELKTLPVSLLCVAYCPPNDNEVLSRTVNMLQDLCVRFPDKTIFAVGDFNVPDVTWMRDPDSNEVRPLLRQMSRRACCLIESIDGAGMKQHVSEPTRGENFLDLIFSRHGHVEATVKKGMLLSDHDEICCQMYVEVRRPPTVNRVTAFNYRRADWDGLRRCLELIPWNNLRDMDIDTAVDMFYDLLDASVHDNVPTVVLRRGYPPWFDGEVRRALRHKEAAFRQKKCNPSNETETDFREKRKTFKNMTSSKYFNYLKGMIGDFKSNPKRFWTYLKCVRGSKASLSVLLDGTSEVHDDVQRANLLNRAFASKFTDPNVHDYPTAPTYDLLPLTRFVMSEGRVRLALDTLQAHKACGPDNISARIIRECREQLVAPLVILFNMSVEQGKFPSRWAEANIVPVYKKGSKKLASNYRSISLTPLFGRLLERCICDTLLCHVRPVLTPYQHGFVPNRSCDTNLACLLKTAWESISSGHQTDVVYTDYSAAFQSVNHKLLLHKLRNSFQISGVALSWLSSYLGNRRQRVVVNGKFSEWTHVLSGTPEGGIISPILFALFINDLPEQLQTNCLLFADDVKLYHKIVSSEDSKLLQADLTRLADWSQLWKLQLNPSKCKSFTITLKRKPVLSTYKIQNDVLENVSSIRDLGIWLDSKLTFAEHIEKIVSKANRMLGVTIRSLQAGHALGETRRPKLQPEPVLAVYYANIRSILEYGCVIWGGAANSHLERLDKIQHKFLIWLASISTKQSQNLEYAHLLTLFKIPSLTMRRKQYDIFFVHKILAGKIDSAFLLGSFPLHVPARNTRAMANTFMHVPPGMKETVKQGVFCRAPKVFNEFVTTSPLSDPFNCTFGQFRSQVRHYVRHHNL